jgi:hypothetical protein
MNTSTSLLSLALIGAVYLAFVDSGEAGTWTTVAYFATPLFILGGIVYA